VKYYFQRDIISSVSNFSSAMNDMETAAQNSDKQKTYDYCRMEYPHLDSILFLDSDELMHCEPIVEQGSTKRYRHREVIEKFLKYVQLKGYEEVLSFLCVL
jgi:hypothetical protein